MALQMEIIKTNILNPLATDRAEFLADVFITIDDGEIVTISEQADAAQNSITDRTDHVCIPGLIDTHVHLSQYYIRGSHSPNLLHWLNTYTFKEEHRSKDRAYARVVAQDFFADLISKGTTTSVIYTAPFSQACDAAFEVAQEMGVRAIIGMTMMDMHSPDFLIQETGQAFEDSVSLFEKWTGKADLLDYIFTPRFALTCSGDLMRLTGDFAQENDAYIQTHLSENKDEIQRALELFPECKNYTDIYQQHNLLGSKTILGHSIHLGTSEIDVLKNTHSKISHCPDSNFFIKSGMFQWEQLRDSGLDFSLATDVAGGTSLSMFNVMKMANFRQETYLIPPQEVFYYATLGGARAIGKENQIGSIMKGKAADLVFLKFPDFRKYDTTELLSKLIYTHEDVEITHTMVAGKVLSS